MALHGWAGRRISRQLFCGMASVTANSRMIYAFSRDGALPFSRTWHKLTPPAPSPTPYGWPPAARSSWACPTCGTAYAAATSIATIGLYIASVMPTFLRLRLRLRQGDRFERGPWHLGSWSTLVGTIAVVWVLVITVLFMLPQTSPLTAKTFNYALIAVGVVVFCGTWWLASARKRFLNPAHARTPPTAPNES
ncbi:amino acid permease [Streptomyces sp. NPDC005808]|uniref:amino acid permease n=1 Tax=Streptomyces sp. NPDC005808 TaxID=3364734 RepID=UPI00368F1CF9